MKPRFLRFILGLQGNTAMFSGAVVVLVALLSGCTFTQPLPTSLVSAKTIVHADTREASPALLIPSREIASLSATSRPTRTTASVAAYTVTPARTQFQVPSLTAVPDRLFTSPTATATNAISATPTPLLPSPTSGRRPVVRFEGLDDNAAACTTLIFYTGDAIVEKLSLAASEREGNARLVRIPGSGVDRLQILGSPDGRCPWRQGSFADIDPNRVSLGQEDLTLRFLPRPSAEGAADAAPESTPPCDCVVPLP
ncbi:MAG: hypothetical protein H5T69_01215 [Chloroflexi bacterium]|nr:hypothetical protein [Chloroflexota bacterium]